MLSSEENKDRNYEHFCQSGRSLERCCLALNTLNSWRLSATGAQIRLFLIFSPFTIKLGRGFAIAVQFHILFRHSIYAFRSLFPFLKMEHSAARVLLTPGFRKMTGMVLEKLCQCFKRHFKDCQNVTNGCMPPDSHVVTAGLCERR